eukprot:3180465-Amphidinium_carterae.1
MPALAAGKLDTLKEMLPPDVRCTIDTINGRVLILCTQSKDRKSFSWSQRGTSESMKLSLRQAWHWHELHTGKQC